jgi:DNA-binding MarR family transcriptional regulator
MADDADEWMSISDLARAIGRDKGGVSRRVARFESQGLLTTRVGESGQKLVSRSEYDRVASETTDTKQELNGLKHRSANGNVPASASPAGPPLARAQAAKTDAQAQLARLDLSQRLGQLLPIDDTRQAAARCAMRLRRTVETMHVRAEETADNLARNGSAFARTLVAAMRNDPAGARSFFKALSRDQLQELARMAAAIDEDEPEEPSSQMAAVRAGSDAATFAEA